MVKYAWFFGRVGVIVEYFEQIGPDEIEGGARVEVRRVEKDLLPGAPPGVSGFRVLPVIEGIWRADLFHFLTRTDNQQIYHYHPNYVDGDVGERELDPELTADHIGWAVRQIEDLPALLQRAGAGELVDDIDLDDLRHVLPAIRAAIEHCDRGRERFGRRLLTAEGQAQARRERLASPV